MDARNQKEWFTKSHEEKCAFIEKFFNDEMYRDEITPGEIDKLAIIAYDITQRRVSKVYDNVSTYIENVARNISEKEGITFAQAVEKIASALKQGEKI